MISQETIRNSSKLRKIKVWDKIHHEIQSVKLDKCKPDPACWMNQHLLALEKSIDLYQANKEAARREKRKISAPTFGSGFELISGFMFQELGIAPDGIKCQWKSKDKIAEIDYLIDHANRRWLISLKASCRERWKTADQEILSCKIALELEPFRSYGENAGIQGLLLMHCENRSKNDPKRILSYEERKSETCKKIKEIDHKARSIEKAISPYDEDTFNHCIDCILKGKSLHST